MLNPSFSNSLCINGNVRYGIESGHDSMNSLGLSIILNISLNVLDTSPLDLVLWKLDSSTNYLEDTSTTPMNLIGYTSNTGSQLEIFVFQQDDPNNAVFSGVFGVEATPSAKTAQIDI